MKKWILVLGVALNAAAHAAPIRSAVWDSVDAPETRGLKNCLFASGIGVYIGSHYGMKFSKDHGETWSSGQFNPVPAIWRFSLHGGMLFAAGFDSGILLSPDSGRTWRSLARPAGSNSTFRGVFAYEGGLLAGSYYQGIYRSTDTGKTWTKTKGPSGIGVFHEFAVAGKTLLASSIYDGILISTDSGANWKRPVSGLDTTVTVSSIATVGSTAYCAAFGVLRKSTDEGATWKKTDMDSGVKVTTVVVHETRVLAGTTKHGAFQSEDAGKTWTRLGSGLPDSLGIKSFALGGRYLYAETNDFALWRLEVIPPSTSTRRITPGRTGNRIHADRAWRGYSADGRRRQEWRTGNP